MWLQFDGIHNVRDLGGLPAANGKTVRYGRLLRGAALTEASDRDLQRLSEDLAVRHLVDFRFADEGVRQPNRPIPGAKVHVLPALERVSGLSRPSEGEPDFFTMFQNIYARFAESDYTASAYRKFFDILLDCTDGAVYFHCAQGKDRTGIAAILVLTALGVDRGTAIEDFFLSVEGLRCELEKPTMPGSANWSLATRERLVFVFPEALAQFTDRVDQRFGGIEGFLRQRIGLTDKEFSMLRELYLE